MTEAIKKLTTIRGESVTEDTIPYAVHCALIQLNLEPPFELMLEENNLFPPGNGYPSSTGI